MPETSDATTLALLAALAGSQLPALGRWAANKVVDGFARTPQIQGVFNKAMTRVFGADHELRSLFDDLFRNPFTIGPLSG